MFPRLGGEMTDLIAAVLIALSVLVLWTFLVIVIAHGYGWIAGYAEGAKSWSDKQDLRENKKGG